MYSTSSRPGEGDGSCVLRTSELTELTATHSSSQFCGASQRVASDPFAGVAQAQAECYERALAAEAAHNRGAAEYEALSPGEASLEWVYPLFPLKGRLFVAR